MAEGTAVFEKEVLCRLEDVTKRYGRTAKSVLSHLSLEIYAGEILGVFGANGAGKSTLMEVIAGVLKVNEGRVTYAKGVKGSIGYVPQELSLYESMTGKDNLKFFGIATGLPLRTIAVRSAWLLEALDLTEKGDDAVDTYSGGMKRRLHLASALMHTPRLLLLDEPTVGADKESAGRIRELLLKQRDQGVGIVIISHLAEDFAQICDRTVSLQDGRFGA